MTQEDSEFARRSVLRRGGVVLGAAGVGAVLSRLGAGSSVESSTAEQASAPPPASGTAATPAPAAGKPAVGKGASLGPAGAVPVGGGTIFAKAKVVVTQPTAGVYMAFDATCTHELCLLAEVEDGTINCACHGGKYSIADGKAVALPARKRLPAKTVTVANGTLFVV